MNSHLPSDVNRNSKNGNTHNNKHASNKQTIAINHESETPLSYTYSGNANIGSNCRNTNESVFNELLKRKKIDSEEGSKKKNKHGLEINSPQSGRGELRR